jgi:hypothetical protein
MIRDLDDTLKALFETHAPVNSALAGAEVSFDLPDAAWRSALQTLTVNCYLYDVRQNMAMRTAEAILVRSADNKRAARVSPPARIDCAYCITAWSTATTGAVYEEHRLLSQALQLLLRFPTIPPGVLQGSLAGQFPPYPGIAAAQEGVKNMPDFWHALDQKLKPSLNYIVTLAMMTDAIPTDSEMVDVPGTIKTGADHLE